MEKPNTLKPGMVAIPKGVTFHKNGQTYKGHAPEKLWNDHKDIVATEKQKLMGGAKDQKPTSTKNKNVFNSESV